MSRYSQKIIACVAVWLSFGQMMPNAYGQQANAPKKIIIVIEEGQGAIHNVRSKTSPQAVVRIEDENRQQLGAVPVVFSLPTQGASGTFVNGDTTLVVTTDPQGRAVARGIKPNSIPGKIEIRVDASYRGSTATATVTQFNMDVRNSQSSSGGKGKWIAILVAAGAAGAAGAAFGLKGGSSSPSPAPAPTPTLPPIGISPGAGSVGPPPQ